MQQHSLNQVFGFFLKHKNVKPEFRKTKFGYQTYKTQREIWRAFEDSLTITKMETSKEFNGFDYDDVWIETKYQIVHKKDGGTDINFVYKKQI